MSPLDTRLANYTITGRLTRADIVRLLELEDAADLAHLFTRADQVRHEHLGNEVHLRALIEFSNHCTRNCTYCGLNYSNKPLLRYRMTPAEIVAAAAEAVSLGFGTVVLQSGEDFYYTGELVADIIQEIKRTGAAVTLSLGERAPADLLRWREAGADRYLLKFETSDPDLYSQLHPGHSLSRRLHCLKILGELGYQVGSGNIVGLPGQAAAALADDILLMRQLPLAMAGIGPFIPHPSTPLAVSSPGSITLSLKVLALTRLLLPRAHLPATTALGSVDKDGRRAGLLAGANVLMLNVTPLKYRRLYEIYPAKAEISAGPRRLKSEAEKLVAEIGRRVAAGPGHGYLPPPALMS